VGALVQPACDPISGQPELKATQATLAPALYAAYGFLLARGAVAIPDGVWWARSTVEGGVGYRIAAPAVGGHWSGVAKRLIGGGGSRVELLDEGQGCYRAAIVQDGRLMSCLFLATTPHALPSWEWLKQQLAAPALSDAARRALLAGRVADASDLGPIVCACFGVGRAQICKVIASGRGCSAEDVGAELKAGTNCGSCLPEVRRLVAETAKSAPPVTA
jgi:assimilatory nitrate reductase catalytic subunit